MTWAYRGIILLLAGLIVWNMMRERRLSRQIEAALALAPLILRLLAIK